MGARIEAGPAPIQDGGRPPGRSVAALRWRRLPSRAGGRGHRARTGALSSRGARRAAMATGVRRTFRPPLVPGSRARNLERGRGQRAVRLGVVGGARSRRSRARAALALGGGRSDPGRRRCLRRGKASRADSTLVVAAAELDRRRRGDACRAAGLRGRVASVSLVVAGPGVSADAGDRIRVLRRAQAGPGFRRRARIPSRARSEDGAPAGRETPSFMAKSAARLYAGQTRSRLFCYRWRRLRQFEHSDRPEEIAVVGDSFVESSLVERGASWPAVLAARFGVSVRNLGVSSFSPQQSRVVLDRFALPRQPRLVLFLIYEGNDVTDAGQFQEFVASRMSWLRVPRQAGPSIRRLTDHPPPGSVAGLGDAARRRSRALPAQRSRRRLGAPGRQRPESSVRHDRGRNGLHRIPRLRAAGRDPFSRRVVEPSGLASVASSGCRCRGGEPLGRRAVRRAAGPEQGRRSTCRCSREATSPAPSTTTSATLPRRRRLTAPPGTTRSAQHGALDSLLDGVARALGASSASICCRRLQARAAEGHQLYFPFTTHWNVEGNRWWGSWSRPSSRAGVLPDPEAHRGREDRAALPPRRRDRLRSVAARGHAASTSPSISTSSRAPAAVFACRADRGPGRRRSSAARGDHVRRRIRRRTGGGAAAARALRSTGDSVPADRMARLEPAVLVGRPRPGRAPGATAPGSCSSSISVGSGRTFRWRSDPTPDPSDEIAGAAAWKAWEEPRCGRHRLYRRLWEELLPLDHERQQRISRRCASGQVAPTRRRTATVA